MPEQLMGIVVAFALWASAVDARRRLLPNRLLGPMCIASTTCQLARWLGGPWLAWLPWLDAIDPALPSPAACVGIALGSLAVLSLAELAHRSLVGAPGLGFGDVKLVACWTLALGDWGLAALALGCATGALWGIVHGEDAFPLGPFVTGWAIAIALALWLLS